MLRKLTHRNYSFQYRRGHKNGNKSDPFVDDETTRLDPNIVHRNIHIEDVHDVMYYRDHLYADVRPAALWYMPYVQKKISI